jgi:hypothetical protein
MKRVTSIIILLVIITGVVSSQILKPYTLGATSDKSISETADLLKEKLSSHGLQIAGEYAPANDADRWLIVVTSPEVLKAAATIGNLGGFAATLRVALTRENNEVLISYTTPEYWWNAYYRDDFDRVKSVLLPVRSKLASAVSESGTSKNTAFGSEKGIKGDDLRSYRYMVGMPRFDNTVELNTFSNYQQAVSKIESRLSNGVPGVKEVYSVEVPGKELKLYGLALSGETGESKFLPVIDIGSPKHTAFLPYEILVSGKDVHMLHGRYRIALSFPDLTMGTFTKIMSAPGDIEDLLRQLTH